MRGRNEQATKQADAVQCWKRKSNVLSVSSSGFWITKTYLAAIETTWSSSRASLENEELLCKFEYLEAMHTLKLSTVPAGNYATSRLQIY